MPLQNRVDPHGRLISTPARGAWMGNRGLLHDAQRRIVRPFRTRAWLICRLEFKDRRRPVMSPGFYTELFFLDEATALAAGHRPCAECRRSAYQAFRDAVAAGGGGRFSGASDLDAALHRDRDVAGGAPRIAEIRDLPDGAMIDRGGDPWLVWRGHLHRWTAEGYGARAAPSGGPVRVLTPAPSLAALRAGYPVQAAVAD